MDGEYKNGVEIVVTYQAVDEATGKTVTMDVYDESFALDAAKSVAAMTEVVATGRYKAAFTPDAEGEWIVVMKNTTDSNGAVVKAFSVGGHNIDGIGDAIAAVDTKVALDTTVAKDSTVAKAATVALDATVAKEATIVALNDVTPAEVNTQCDTALTDYDAATGAEITALNNVSIAQIVAELETYDGVKKVELDAIQGGTETLETIKTAVDAIGSPAMVG